MAKPRHDSWESLVLAVFDNRDGQELIEQELSKRVSHSDPAELRARAALHDYFLGIKQVIKHGKPKAR